MDFVSLLITHDLSQCSIGPALIFLILSSKIHSVLGQISALTFHVYPFSKGSPTGELKQAKGRAINDHFDRAPGEFRLTFDDIKSPIVGFSWVVKVGEVEEGQWQYPWAIVSVPFQTSLFILARDISEFKEKYEAEVLALVHDMGFKHFYNKPIETVHPEDCTYPPRPKPEPPTSFDGSVEVLIDAHF